MIRLDRNEMPYPPPEKVIEASKKGLLDLNRYPDLEDLATLRRMLSAYLNVEEEYVFLGSGSDSLIMQVIHLFSKKDKVVSVDPTFSFAARIIGALGTRLLKIRMNEPYSSLPIKPLIGELEGSCLMFIDNPNNPTGSLILDRDDVDELCKSIDGVLLIDEAYYEFSRFTVVDMIKDHPNLAVIRTMSKAFGLAGLRIGYMIAGETVAEKFSRQALPYALSKPSVYAAIEALEDLEYVKNYIEFIVEERERVKEEMLKLGIKVYPSSSNFLMLRTYMPSVTRKLKEYGLLVTDLSGQMPLGCIRVSLSTRKENDILLDSLRKIF